MNGIVFARLDGWYPARGGHMAGVEAIEAAFDKIIQQKLTSRKKVKGLNIKKKKIGDDYVPPFLERQGGLKGVPSLLSRSLT